MRVSRLGGLARNDSSLGADRPARRPCYGRARSDRPDARATVERRVIGAGVTGIGHIQRAGLGSDVRPTLANPARVGHPGRVS
jgi:hypothetical protein